ncbi:MAG: hypothetical protein SNJ70_00405 [Armatimonadota bacterium]
MKEAIGYAQEIPGGLVFEIGNGCMHRRMHCISGKLNTTSIMNVINGEEYLDDNNYEFQILLRKNEEEKTITSKQFSFKNYETPVWDNNTRLLKINLESRFEDKPIELSVYYQAQADKNFISKWIEIKKNDIKDWVITSVVIENMKFLEKVEGVVPKPRYPEKFPNDEDNVHGKPDQCDTSDPNIRFQFGENARAVVHYWGNNEGLFFFTKSLLGKEEFTKSEGLVMSQREYLPLKDGLTTDPADIGGYRGPAELGFKRYTEYLMDNWCVIKGKEMPVSWSTWMITLADHKALLSNYDRDLILEYINYIKEAGFYTTLHLDLGWEAEMSMKVDTKKFPNGMEEIVEKAREAGLDMTYWVNPFSSSYWKTIIEERHPEYLVPGKVNRRSHATAICIMTEYYEYVKKRYIELATQLNARVIYWDGNDWNIPECCSDEHDHCDQDELEVNAWKRLNEICQATHAARKDTMFVCFSIPFNNHRLNALDQEQISDTYAHETGKAELLHRQQLYQMTWEHPYYAIWGSWYGIDWHDAGRDNLETRPLEELMHAEMAMIGNGICQAGGGFDLKRARPEFMEWLKKLFAFRKRFSNYFNTYQHVLDFPDGKKIDGEGHVIDGKGFIVLVNPTRETLSVKIPLDEVELELEKEKKYTLTDWSNLVAGELIGEFEKENAPTIELKGLEVKYLGIDIE